MSIVNTLALKSNRQIKVNFDGGDLSLLFTHHYPARCVNSNIKN